MSTFYAITTMIEVLEQDQHHLDLVCKPQIDTFLEKARSVRDLFLTSISGLRLRSPEDLHIQIVTAAHEAEDAIEGCVINQVLHGTDEIVSTLDLTNLTEEFESIRVKLLGVADQVVVDVPHMIDIDIDTLLFQEQFNLLPTVDQRTKLDVPAIFEDDFQNLKACLIESSPKLQVVNIDGMLGMGKRTLARRLYNDPEIAAHFRTRAWVTCPFTNTIEKSCLLNLLEGLGKLTKDMHLKTVKELKVHIRNELQRIKYFIVIHDVIGAKNWVTFTSLFRDYGVGARVFYTTDKIDHSTLSTRGGQIYALRSMNDSESWLLFCQKVFGSDHCPYELEPIGRIIIGLCKGYPLAVTLVAGLLTTNKKTPLVWKIIAQMLQQNGQMREGSVSVDANIIGQILKIIYYCMPSYLRPCLLYVGVFHESRDIKASTIIKLWIAEGFVTQSRGTSSENLARMYLQVLIDTNLLSLTQLEPNGSVKAFQVHRFLLLFYWWQAAEEKFLGSTLFCYTWTRGEGKNMRRLSMDGLFTPQRGTELPVLARSFLALSGASMRQDYNYLELRMLRVLAVFQLEFYQFPIQIMKLVLLRYLAISCHSNLPTSSFSMFRNLQTLILRRLPTFRAFSLPSDLWGLTQLVHVKCKETILWSYPRYGKRVVHEKLQTLTNVQLFGIENEFLREVPNVKQLGIFCNIAMHTVFDLACLDKLEALKCSTNWSLASRNFLFYLTLPLSLRKLTFSLCRIPSELMEVVGSLPNLEHLKLQNSDFVDVDSAKTELTWKTVEGGFPRLLCLEMIHLNLVHWITRASHFPSLKHLNVEYCYAMVEIPLDIGNIQTLELIQVNEASPSALVSALKIKEDQEGRGNKLLQLHTYTYVF